MVKCNKEFKEQTLLLSDELGVKKTAEQQGISYHTISVWRIFFHKSRKSPVGLTKADK